jgi:hypothetical protein
MIRKRGTPIVCAAEMKPLRRDRQVKRPRDGGDWVPLRLRRMRCRLSRALEKGKSGAPALYGEIRRFHLISIGIIRHSCVIVHDEMSNREMQQARLALTSTLNAQDASYHALR